jgi:hypothetical protein
MLRADTNGMTALIVLSSILCHKPGRHMPTSTRAPYWSVNTYYPTQDESPPTNESTAFKYNERSASNDTGMKARSLALKERQNSP